MKTFLAFLMVVAFIIAVGAPPGEVTHAATQTHTSAQSHITSQFHASVRVADEDPPDEEPRTYVYEGSSWIEIKPGVVHTDGPIVSFEPWGDDMGHACHDMSGILDKECAHRRLVWNLLDAGEAERAKATMCQNDQIRKAFKKAGEPCPETEPSAGTRANTVHHLDGNQPVPTTIAERAQQQAEEYMVLTNRLSNERDEALVNLEKSMEIIYRLIDDKADLAGELAKTNVQMIDMKHELGLTKGNVLFKNGLIVFMMVIIVIFVLNTALRRHQDKTLPKVPFFSSWFNRELVVKPTSKEEN